MLWFTVWVKILDLEFGFRVYGLGLRVYRLGLKFRVWV